MTTIVTRAGKGSALTHDEMDANLTGLNVGKVETSDIGVTVQAYSANLDEYAAVNPTAQGLALLDDATSADQRTTLGLGNSATLNTGTTAGTVATGDHNHSGVYEPADATILKDADIGVTVEAYSANHLFRTSSTGSAILPTGTTAQRDGSPAAGYFRYNTSNAAFEGYNGSAWAGVGGASGGGGNPFVYENDQTITVDYTLTSGKNGMTAGPISIAAGITVTIPSGSTWTVV